MTTAKANVIMNSSVHVSRTLRFTPYISGKLVLSLECSLPSRFTGNENIIAAKYVVHSGQKRLSKFSASGLLKNDIFDFTVSASQLINKYLLQRQRQHIYKKRLCRGQNVRHFLRRSAQD